MDRLYQLERRVLTLEGALRNQGISLDEIPPDPVNSELEEILLTPKELRANGQAYCPKCYSFGHVHRLSCPYVDQGVSKHVKDL